MARSLRCRTSPWNARQLRAWRGAKFRTTPARAIRDRPAILELFAQVRPDAIMHDAAQPSHDLAASRPFDDFDVNAVGTLNLLEASRRSARESPFVQMSTNKVYGDAPNRLNLVEKLTNALGLR
jgi:nucleoside-diphosphate-sugar epimerase